MEEMNQQTTPTEPGSEPRMFRFKSLKTYGDTEWLADNRKHYRQVYDASELSYIYAELCFYNKGYDREDWSATIELKCFNNALKNKPLCHLVLRRDITRAEPVVHIREGWGNKKEGAFWKPGTYFWEAYIDGVKVGSRFFYVQSAGQAPAEIPDDYAILSGVSMYEGPMDDVPAGERVYLSQLDAQETRFVYLELQFQNQLLDRDWYFELAIKFFNQSRELKGRVVKFVPVPSGENTVMLSVGWGSDARGTWREGVYTAELIFMDRWMGTVYIEMGPENMAGHPMVWLPGEDRARMLFGPVPGAQGLEQVLESLDSLIGLETVKRQVRDRAAYMEFIRLRQQKGYEEDSKPHLHAVFKGNPGTGKTTVANLMGEIYFQLGLLSRGHVHAVDRADLVGEFIGQTAPKVREAIEKARGGVLFIDEAYALARTQDDLKDFGREVIEILVKEMSDGPGDLAIIAAGYPTEMDHFIQSNPGLKSRIKMEVNFPDYLPEELSRIAGVAAEQMGVSTGPEASRLIDQILIREYRDRDKSFGNARFVFDLIERAKVQLGLRVMSTSNPEELPNEDLEAILPEDILKAMAKDGKAGLLLPIDEELLEEALRELEGLRGLAAIKRDIRETVMLVRYYLSQGETQLHRFSMHTLFVGNPGTGKTTVARILARIYKALGLLERGHVVETDRQGLVAGYVGQTAIKTAERIREAQGGVLFIDEAYSLTQSGTGTAGDFGDEAIQTLLKRMEDGRGNFFLFAAGYPDNMEKFLKANPGLKSRFDKTLVFEDYQADELVAIAESQLAESGFRLSDEASRELNEWIHVLYRQRDKFFGNARLVRQITEGITKHHRTLLAQSHAEGRPMDKDSIGPLSIKATRESLSSGEWGRQGIGFRAGS